MKNEQREKMNRSKNGLRHLKNIFETSELSRKGTVATFATVQSEGNKKIYREIRFLFTVC